MSYVKAAPELLEAASSDLAGISTTLSSSRVSAAATTVSVAPPGADVVSAGVSALFGAHGEAYQRLGAQAGAYHDQFVQLLQSGARSYSVVDAANQASLQLNDALGSAGTAATPVAAAASQAPSSWAAGGSALAANSLAPAAASLAPAPETPIYALLANSPAFEGLADWLSS